MAEYEYIPPEVTAEFRKDFRCATFLHIATPNPIRMAFGYSGIKAQIADLDLAAHEYKPVGLMQDIPELQVLLNGLAEEVKFTVSGLDWQLADSLYTTAPRMVGIDITLGIAPQDDRWQPMTQIVRMWSGICDYLVQEQAPQFDISAPVTRSITLTTLSGEVARSKQPLATYTDQAQKAISADDKFCERTPIYFPQRMIAWPRYSG